MRWTPPPRLPGTIHFCYAVTIRAAEPEAQHQAGHIGVHDDSVWRGLLTELTRGSLAPWTVKFLFLDVMGVDELMGNAVSGLVSSSSDMLKMESYGQTEQVTEFGDSSSNIEHSNKDQGILCDSNYSLNYCNPSIQLCVGNHSLT